MSTELDPLDQATFGGGCFWCTEAVFKELRGVRSVVSGYAGGRVAHPSYEQVCSGSTGHAEAVQIAFDPAEVSYEDLLEVFFKTHDPTSLNRQGHDVGTQYRSVIFYHDDRQKHAATKMKERLDREGVFDGPIVTEITKLPEFYPAEDYHQNYFANHPDQAYCAAVIRPKVAKFRAEFEPKLR
jgi:peptide-methionine (S)-S-oxide reductase